MSCVLLSKKKKILWIASLGCVPSFEAPICVDAYVAVKAEAPGAPLLTLPRTPTAPALLMSGIWVTACRCWCRAHLTASGSLAAVQFLVELATALKSLRRSKARPTLEALCVSSLPRAWWMAQGLTMAMSKRKKPSCTKFGAASSLPSDHQLLHLSCWCCNPLPLTAYPHQQYGL